MSMLGIGPYSVLYPTWCMHLFLRRIIDKHSDMYQVWKFAVILGLDQQKTRGFKGCIQGTTETWFGILTLGAAAAGWAAVGWDGEEVGCSK
jgi:hypothetical protein